MKKMDPWQEKGEISRTRNEVDIRGAGRCQLGYLVSDEDL